MCIKLVVMVSFFFSFSPAVQNNNVSVCLQHLVSNWFNVLVCNEKENERTYISKADIRKNMRRMRNGPGRNQCTGGRVENSKGFAPNSFDRVLLDAPCSALGLRPRLFAGEVMQSNSLLPW